MTHCKINKKNEWKYSTSQRNTKDVQVSALTKIEFLYIMIPDSCNGILDFIKVIQIIDFLLSFWFYCYMTVWHGNSVSKYIFNSCYSAQGPEAYNCCKP